MGEAVLLVPVGSLVTFEPVYAFGDEGRLCKVSDSFTEPGTSCKRIAVGSQFELGFSAMTDYLHSGNRHT